VALPQGFQEQFIGGPVEGSDGETWAAVEAALTQGIRGLPARSSLAKLRSEHQGVRNRSALPALTPAAIREWARLHQERTGRRPTAQSGPVADAPGKTWSGINLALWQGLRGLPGGSGLSKLLGGPASGRWTTAEAALLGTMPDEAIARQTGRPVGAVTQKRCKLGIPTFSDGRKAVS
jgi:hypothetical protein